MRILQRVKFLKRNKRLCEKAFVKRKQAFNMNIDHSHTDWKYPDGRTLIMKARADIGYSCCTANCDIYWSLLGLYQYLIKEKII